MAFDLGVWNGMSDAERLKDMLRVIEERDRLAAELSAARADAERVEYCVRNALALDFAYGYEERCAVVIQIPKDARYSVIGFRNIIDTARAASSAGAQYATGTDCRCPKCKGLGPCSECNPDPRRALDEIHQMDHEDSAGGPQS